MMAILRFLYTLIEPISKDEDLRRREFILNILLLGSLTFTGVAIILILIYSTILNPTYKGFPLGGSLIIFSIFLFLYSLSRNGFSILSAYLFILTYFMPATYFLYKWGADLPQGLLFYALIIIMSGILINTGFAFITALIGSVVLSIIAYLQINKIVSPDLYWKDEMLVMGDVIITIATFGVITTVSYLFNREIGKSLKRARRSEKELQKERDSLEVKVEERTKELKKSQTEKVSQLYRFAEFGQLSAGLFHDSINLLSAIYLNLKQVKNSKQEEIIDTRLHLDRVVKITKRMENFIVAVRKQIIQQEIEINFSLFEEISQVVQVFSYKAREANVEINFSCPKDIKIRGDPIKFNQLITNLICNAIDAYEKIDKNKQPREILIKLYRKNHNICLFVQDWGIGIPKECIDKIFEPLFTTKGFDKGTGIGLSIVKKITEKDLKGTIKVESEQKKGAKFIVEFPIKSR